MTRWLSFILTSQSFRDSLVCHYAEWSLGVSLIVLNTGIKPNRGLEFIHNTANSAVLVTSRRSPARIYVFPAMITIVWGNLYVQMLVYYHGLGDVQLELKTV